MNTDKSSAIKALHHLYESDFHLWQNPLLGAFLVARIYFRYRRGTPWLSKVGKGTSQSIP